MYLVYDICVNVLFIRYLLLLFNITSPTESVIGKITLVKYLFLSTFTHNSLALTNPSEATLNEIDDESAQSIRQNKPPKCRKGISVLMNLKNSPIA